MTRTLSTGQAGKGLGQFTKDRLSVSVPWRADFLCHGAVRSVGLSGGQDALLQGRFRQTQIDRLRPDCQHTGNFLPWKPAGMERDLRLHTRISSLQVLALAFQEGRKGGNQHVSPCSMPGPELGAFTWAVFWPPSHPLRMWRSERWGNLHKVTKPPSLFGGINPKVTSCWYPRLHQHPSKMNSGVQGQASPSRVGRREE